MIKFMDKLVLILFVAGLEMASQSVGIVALDFVLMLVLWFVFWYWLDKTFISVSYVNEQLEKGKSNDDKNSSSSGT